MNSFGINGDVLKQCVAPGTPAKDGLGLLPWEPPGTALLQACPPAGMETGRGSRFCRGGTAGCPLGPSLLPVPLSITSSKCLQRGKCCRSNSWEALGRFSWGGCPPGASTAPCYGCAIPPWAPLSLQHAIYQAKTSGFIFFKSQTCVQVDFDKLTFSRGKMSSVEVSFLGVAVPYYAICNPPGTSHKAMNS